MAEFLEQVALIVIGVCVTATATAFLAYLRSRSQCFKALQNLVEKLDKRTFRIEKTIILKAQMIDEQTKKAHPETMSSLEKLVLEMLHDEKGNL